MWGGRSDIRGCRCCGRSGSSDLFLLGGITGIMCASPALDFHLQRHVLRRRALPQHAGRRIGVRGLRGPLLLVPEDVGATPVRAARPDPFRAVRRRVHADLHPAVRPRDDGDAETHRRLRRHERLDAAQPGVDDRLGDGLGLGVLPFVLAVGLALRKPATEPPNPWGGGTLEWWTDSPPPHGNFRDLPPIRVRPDRSSMRDGPATCDDRAIARGPAARVDGRLRTPRWHRVLVPHLRGGRNPAADRVRDGLRDRCGDHPREAACSSSDAARGSPGDAAAGLGAVRGRAGTGRRRSSAWSSGRGSRSAGSCSRCRRGGSGCRTAMTEADPGRESTNGDD